MAATAFTPKQMGHIIILRFGQIPIPSLWFASIVAAIFIGLENSARIVASSRGLQFIRALPVDIGRATDPTSAPIRSRTKFHRNIKSINKGYIKEIQVIELV